MCIYDGIQGVFMMVVYNVYWQFFLTSSYPTSACFNQHNIGFTSTIRISFGSADMALMAKQALEVDAELQPAKLVRGFTVEDGDVIVYATLLLHLFSSIKNSNK